MSLLWHDDVRRPPSADWLWVRTNEDARKALEHYPIDFISMDHDLGMDWVDVSEPISEHDYIRGESRKGCGCDLARWMVEQDILPPVIRLHSMNPVGASEMALIIQEATPRLDPPQLIIAPFDPNWRTE